MPAPCNYKHKVEYFETHFSMNSTADSICYSIYVAAAYSCKAIYSSKSAPKAKQMGAA